MGLGVPFFLIGIGISRLLRALDFVKRNYHWFAGVSGVLMIGIGVLLVSGLWQSVLTPVLNRLSQITPPI
jgi:cytochrome c-type biogenesis protein